MRRSKEFQKLQQLVIIRLNRGYRGIWSPLEELMVEYLEHYHVEGIRDQSLIKEIEDNLEKRDNDDN